MKKVLFIATCFCFTLLISFLAVNTVSSFYGKMLYNSFLMGSSFPLVKSPFFVAAIDNAMEYNKNMVYFTAFIGMFLGLTFWYILSFVSTQALYPVLLRLKKNINKNKNKHEKKSRIVVIRVFLATCMFMTSIFLKEHISNVALLLGCSLTKYKISVPILLLCALLSVLSFIMHW